MGTTSALPAFSFLILSHAWLGMGFIWPFSHLGEFRPTNPVVCTGDDVILTCALYSDNEGNSSNLVFQRNGQYVSSNQTAIIDKLTRQLYLREVAISQDYELLMCCLHNCSASGRIEGQSLRVYNTPVNVSAFGCVVYNWDANMTCSWDLRVDYHSDLLNNDRFIKCQWKIHDLPFDWTDCPNISPGRNSSHWLHSSDGNYNAKNISFRISVTSPGCNKTAITEVVIDTADIVQPAPVESLMATSFSSSCVFLNWTHEKEFRDKRFQVSYEAVNGRVSMATRNVTVTNCTVCQLFPYTEYRFNVRVHPLHEAGFWSDEEAIQVTTLPDIPAKSPSVTAGCFTRDQYSCPGQGTRPITLYWKPLSEYERNGPVPDIQITIEAGTGTHVYYVSDGIAQKTLTLQCDTEYSVTLQAYNDVGLAAEVSTVIIPSAEADLPVSKLVRVEMLPGSTEAGTQSVSVEWREDSKPGTLSDRAIHQYTLYWCRSMAGECVTPVQWLHFDKHTHKAVVNISQPEDNSYGISVATEALQSSGFTWEKCVYTHGTEPGVPEGLTVQPGADDNTLFVKWLPLPCQSGTPYITGYRIQYCQNCQGENKVNVTVEPTESSVILPDLDEDRRYEIRIQAMSDGQEGPLSDPVYGSPVNHSLKPGALAGIVVAGVGLLLIIALMYCCRGFLQMLWKKLTTKQNVDILAIEEITNNNQNSELPRPGIQPLTNQTSHGSNTSAEEDHEHITLLCEQNAADQGMPMVSHDYLRCDTAETFVPVSDDRSTYSRGRQRTGHGPPVPVTMAEQGSDRPSSYCQCDVAERPIPGSDKVGSYSRVRQNSETGTPVLVDQHSAGCVSVDVGKQLVGYFTDCRTPVCTPPAGYVPHCRTAPIASISQSTGSKPVITDKLNTVIPTVPVAMETFRVLQRDSHHVESFPWPTTEKPVGPYSKVRQQSEQEGPILVNIEEQASEVPGSDDPLQNLGSKQSGGVPSSEKAEQNLGYSENPGGVPSSEKTEQNLGYSENPGGVPCSEKAEQNLGSKNPGGVPSCDDPVQNSGSKLPNGEPSCEETEQNLGSKKTVVVNSRGYVQEMDCAMGPGTLSSAVGDRTVPVSASSDTATKTGVCGAVFRTPSLSDENKANTIAGSSDSGKQMGTPSVTVDKQIIPVPTSSQDTPEETGHVLDHRTSPVLLDNPTVVMPTSSQDSPEETGHVLDNRTSPVLLDNPTVVMPIRSQDVPQDTGYVMDNGTSSPVLLDNPTVAMPIRSKDVSKDTGYVMDNGTSSPVLLDNPTVAMPIRSQDVSKDTGYVLDNGTSSPVLLDNPTVAMPIRSKDVSKETGYVMDNGTSPPVLLDNPTIAMPIRSQDVSKDTGYVMDNGTSSPVLLDNPTVAMPIRSQDVSKDTGYVLDNGTSSPVLLDNPTVAMPIRSQAVSQDTGYVMDNGTSSPVLLDNPTVAMPISSQDVAHDPGYVMDNGTSSPVLLDNPTVAMPIRSQDTPEDSPRVPLPVSSQYVPQDTGYVTDCESPSVKPETQTIHL